MLSKMIKFFALIIVFFAKNSISIERRWIATWNLDDPRNFQHGIGLCGGRWLRFASQPEFKVMAGRNLSLQGIYFNEDVSVVVGSQVTLTLQETKGRSCQGSNINTAIFERSTRGWWWHPSSWACEGRPWECSGAMPHTHRPPCLTDTVLLPQVENNLYQILLTPPIPTVAKLNIGSNSITTSEFTTFARSPTGQDYVRRIPDSSQESSYVFVEQENTCYDITGCTCHLHSPLQEICKRLGTQCPPIACLQPINMTGFCCPTCGADLLIDHKGRLSFASITSVLEELDGSDSFNHVDTFTSKMHDGFVHVFFTARNVRGDYDRAAQDFTELFNTKVNNNAEYVIESNIASGSAAQQRRQKSKTALIVCLLLGFVALVAVLYYKRQRLPSVMILLRPLLQSSSIAFRRLEAGSTLSLYSRRGTRVGDMMTAPSQAGGGLRFENPSFRQSATSLDTAPTVGECVLSNKGQDNAGVTTQSENPLYIAHTEGFLFSSLTDPIAESIDDSAMVPLEVEDIGTGVLRELVQIGVESDGESGGLAQGEDDDVLTQLAKSRANASECAIESSSDDVEIDIAITQDVQDIVDV